MLLEQKRLGIRSIYYANYTHIEQKKKDLKKDVLVGV